MDETQTTAPDPQWLERIKQCLQTGDKNALADVLESHVRQNPGDAEFALLLVAGQLAQAGQYAEAIPLYIQALETAPTNPQIYFYLGLAYHGLGLKAECHQVWDELPKRFAGHALAQYQAALRLIDQNRMKEAKPLLEQAAGKLDAGSVLHAQVMSTLRVVQRPNSGVQTPIQ